MTKFKASEVKLVGKVNVSAKRLMELGDQLKQIRGSEGNQEVEVYLVPGKDANEASQLAFDFNQKKGEQKPVVQEVKPVETPQPAQKSEPKPEVQAPKVEEKPPEVPKAEVQSSQSKSENNQPAKAVEESAK